MKKHLFILLISFAFLAAGAHIGIPPTWRFAKRHYLQFRAENFWAEEKKRNGTVSDGNAVAWMEIQSVKIALPVLYGASQHNLALYPSLNQDFSLPDENGLKIISAHRDTHFRGLVQVSAGDKIVLELRNSRKISYRIIDTEVVGKDVLEKRLTEKKNENLLALTTCYPFRYFGAAPKRFIVWCREDTGWVHSDN